MIPIVYVYLSHLVLIVGFFFVFIPFIGWNSVSHFTFFENYKRAFRAGLKPVGISVAIIMGMMLLVFAVSILWEFYLG